MVELGVSVSFFTPHIFYWGDDHFRIFLGPDRASRMNPAGSALKRNINFTLHNDSPIVSMGEALGVNTYIEIMESAINRRTSVSGRVLG
jgi:predicted amidohydrolase YtcJ